MLCDVQLSELSSPILSKKKKIEENDGQDNNYVELENLVIEVPLNRRNHYHGNKVSQLLPATNLPPRLEILKKAIGRQEYCITD